jgi:hypothetical protein
MIKSLRFFDLAFRFFKLYKDFRLFAELKLNYHQTGELHGHCMPAAAG